MCKSLIDLKNKIRNFPQVPGVYIMRDASGTVIYIGKANNLKKRVSQYFYKDVSYKQRILQREIYDIEFIIVKDEFEALILENNLIKRFKPRYNILLKDGKTYPYLKIDLNSEYPTLIYTRELKKERDAKYYGPFPKATRLKVARDMLVNIFKLRPCYKMKKRVCLYFHIKKCSGCCENIIDKSVYLERVKELIEFLDDYSLEGIKELQNRMLEESKRLNFERAAVLRDLICVLRMLWGKSSLDDTSKYNIDYIGIESHKDYIYILIFSKRKGKINYYYFKSIQKSGWEMDKNIIQSFLLQYYDYSLEFPDYIYVYEKYLKILNVLVESLKRIHGITVRIIKRLNENQRKSVNLLNKNLNIRIEQFKNKLERKSEIIGKLKDILRLKNIPKRIEAYDISHLGGTLAVGSMVVFINGVPDKSRYRKFKIKSIKGIDDFGMLKEVVIRRFKHKDWDYPDLLVIDGGKGQLNAVLDVLPPDFSGDIISIAKKEEIIFSNKLDLPIRLNKDNEVLRLIMHLRDEAHRFAITYNRKKRKEKLKSVLDDIKGLGPKKLKILREYYPDIDMIRRASTEELSKLPGFSIKLSERIINKINKK